MEKKRDLKDDRSIAAYILLGLLTCGIYNIWVLYGLAKDVNVICKDYGKRTSGVVALVVLSLLTFGLYGVFWWVRLADMLGYVARKKNLNVSVSGGFILACMVLNYLVCGIASWVGVYKIFEVSNELANDYNMEIRRRPELFDKAEN